MSKSTIAYLQGQTAFDRMKSLFANPYEVNTVQRSDWFKGYKFQQFFLRNK